MKPLRYEMDLELARDEVWDAWTAREGVASWWYALEGLRAALGS